jgi:hypothetical protein
MRTEISQITISGDWAVAADGVQWILQRLGGVEKRTGRLVWHNVSFVSSTKDILARCMREKGTPPEAQQKLLASLPVRFSPAQVSGIEPEPKPAPASPCVM